MIKIRVEMKEKSNIDRRERKQQEKVMKTEEIILICCSKLKSKRFNLRRASGAYDDKEGDEAGNNDKQDEHEFTSR